MMIILASLVLLGLICPTVPAYAGDLEDAARAYNGLGFQLLAQCRQSLPNSNKRINDWVTTRMHEKIQTILAPPLDSTLRLIPLDTIYFKGNWLALFETNRMRDLPFTLGNGQTTPHPRMCRTGRYAYWEEDRFQTLELPYADGYGVFTS